MQYLLCIKCTFYYSWSYKFLRTAFSNNFIMAFGIFLGSKRMVSILRISTGCKESFILVFKFRKRNKVVIMVYLAPDRGILSCNIIRYSYRKIRLDGSFLCAGRNMYNNWLVVIQQIKRQTANNGTS